VTDRLVTGPAAGPGAPVDPLDADGEALYEEAPCGFLSARPDGTLVKVNGTFLRWTGYARDDVVGVMRLHDFLTAGDRILFETHIAPLLRMQGHAREMAVEIESAGGGRLPMLANFTLASGPDGEPVLIRAALLDATERRSYERELLKARARAERLEAAATSLARTLQQSLLPPRLPDVPLIDLGGQYHAAGSGAEVGGDFYDVFETRGGHWIVVLGDVCGKGALAASLTSSARHTVRAAAMRVSSPTEIIHEAHEVFVSYHPEQFCTMVVADLEPAGDEAVRLTIASGGHLLPACRRAGGRTEPLGAPGRIVGLLDEPPPLTERSTVLDVGDLVVFCSDGVTEARDPEGFYGYERFVELVSGMGDLDAQVVADRVVADALDFQGWRARDDIAVVALKVRPPAR